ncbi:DUF5333 domain-containing protein [uncultured Shimia sp.]|uniref:DUF5333 domain-containing protein n=1 Tax=uncultured Shimia sp. TaxID=573152 RepID=UPI00260E10B9|nr:DUF5333 domain-containing protein [uncultured Shimia sp.]
MRVMMPIVLAATVFAGAAAAAKPPLSEVAEVEDKLLAAAVGWEISEVCEEISARKLKALGEAWELKARANELGYSNAEIKEHVESKAQKKRMRAKGEAYLKSQGAIYGQPETFCAVGRAEIAKNSAIGALLRAK